MGTKKQKRKRLEANSTRVGELRYSRDEPPLIEDEEIVQLLSEYSNHNLEYALDVRTYAKSRQPNPIMVMLVNGGYRLRSPLSRFSDPVIAEGKTREEVQIVWDEVAGKPVFHTRLSDLLPSRPPFSRR